MPIFSNASTPVDGSAPASSAAGTLWSTSHTFTSVASGEVLVRSSSAAGTVWSLPSAWFASLPRSSATPSTV